MDTISTSLVHRPFLRRRQNRYKEKGTDMLKYDDDPYMNTMMSQARLALGRADERFFLTLHGERLLQIATKGTMNDYTSDFVFQSLRKANLKYNLGYSFVSY